jgi:hypothetical protein
VLHRTCIRVPRPASSSPPTTARTRCNALARGGTEHRAPERSSRLCLVAARLLHRTHRYAEPKMPKASGGESRAASLERVFDDPPGAADGSRDEGGGHGLRGTVLMDPPSGKAEPAAGSGGNLHKLATDSSVPQPGTASTSAPPPVPDDPTVASWDAPPARQSARRAPGPMAAAASPAAIALEVSVEAPSAPSAAPAAVGPSLSAPSVPLRQPAAAPQRRHVQGAPAAIATSSGRVNPTWGNTLATPQQHLPSNRRTKMDPRPKWILGAALCLGASCMLAVCIMSVSLRRNSRDIERLQQGQGDRGELVRLHHELDVTAQQVRRRHCCAIVILKMIVSPRQARAKHRESTRKKRRFLAAFSCTGPGRGGARAPQSS